MLFGHSFVSRLKAHMGIYHYGHNIYCAERLKVDGNIDALAIEGVRGGKAATTAVADILLDRPIPDLVVLDLATNDLNTLSPEEVAGHLFRLAEGLLARGVKLVTPSFVLYRQGWRSKVFNEKVDIINNLIRERALVPPKIDYWPHKGFWRVPAVEWAVDALHPDPDIYLSSIRRALLRGASKVKST